jgi:hypothetical protein
MKEGEIALMVATNDKLGFKLLACLAIEREQHVWI